MRTARTLLSGILAPFLAAWLGLTTYRTLTEASTDHDRDFVFRLSLTALAIALPFFLTLLLAWVDRRRGAFGKASATGLALACLSLGLVWLPLRGMIGRSKQAKVLALVGVPAPGFATVDLLGTHHRLADHGGHVVLINAWATWCGPCREEMPKLDRLFRERQGRGLMVFGISTEEAALQRSFARDRPVSYPLLTVEGDVPAMYRDIVRYPANFLIDREGRLQPAPGSEDSWEALVVRVDALLDHH